MKKFIASILAVLYFTASSGVVLNVHYCMGRVASVKVDNFSLKPNACSSYEQKGDCCKDEFKVFKVDNSHKASVVACQVNAPVAILPSISLIDHSAIIPPCRNKPAAHSPPDISSPKDYILNCVFRV